jgi:imidazolonepropionase-like amidohydrolase
MKIKHLVAAAAAACALGFAVTANAAEQLIVIRAGKLVDVVAGKVLQDQAIVIKGERIVSVGPGAAASVQAGARVIDLSGATVLPGLIDAHTHLTSLAVKGDPLADPAVLTKVDFVMKGGTVFKGTGAVVH